MSSIMEKAQLVLRGLREDRGHALWEVIRERWGSEQVSYGLRRDLRVPFEAPAARLPLTVRPWREADTALLLGLTAPEISEEGREERQTRLDMLAIGLKTCYVAVTDDGSPCYMQWLIGPEENAKVRSYFKGIFPWLAADEALLEGAFTPEAYRGQRIMPRAMAEIAARGTDIGAAGSLPSSPKTTSRRSKAASAPGSCPTCGARRPGTCSAIV